MVKEPERVWIEMACAGCNRSWRIMSIDAEGMRAADAEMRDCPGCGARGYQTGTAPRKPGDLP